MIDLSAVVGPGVAGLLFLAVVNTMPDDPPASFRAIPGWLYRWAHDALKTFTSMRGPGPKGGAGS